MHMLLIIHEVHETDPLIGQGFRGKERQVEGVISHISPSNLPLEDNPEGDNPFPSPSFLPSLTSPLDYPLISLKMCGQTC